MENPPGFVGIDPEIQLYLPKNKVSCPHKFEALMFNQKAKR